MRTKILLLTAAVGAVGLATSMAQTPVFSVNAVGYVNVDVPPKFSMIANPLNTSNNTITALFPNVAEGTTLYKFNNGAFNQSASFLFGNWTGDTGITLNPGEGVFINNPLATAQKVTFVGEVMQGTTPPLSNPIPAGFSIRASQVPQTGPLDGNAPGELGFPVAEGDTVYKFNGATQQYTTHSFNFGQWVGDGRPTINVGESFFVNKVAATAWTRSFSVNQ